MLGHLRPETSSTGLSMKVLYDDDKNRILYPKTTLHVVHKGAEIRRGNEVIRRYYSPKGKASTNYMLTLSDHGEIRLINLETGRISWVPNGGASSLMPIEAIEPLSEASVERLYKKAGWTYTADWDKDDHDKATYYKYRL